MATRDNGNAVPSSGRDESPRSPVHQRLHDGFRTDRRYLSQMVVEAHNERSARVEAVLELKQDLDTSSAKVRAQSAVIQARDQAEKTQYARTHQSLLNQGKNPYEVARRKVVQREAKKERLQLEHNIQERHTDLLKRLEAEKVIQKRREKLKAENRAYEQKYQREMGRAAQEERTNAYLLSRTGKEALDSTGKLVRVYPSQETTIKDHSFGLGHSAVISPDHRRRVVAKVRAKPAHTGTEPSALLLPRRRYSQQDAEELEGPAISSNRSEDSELQNAEKLLMPPLIRVKPGQDLHEVNHSLLPSNDVKLPLITENCSRGPQDFQQDEENRSEKEMSISITHQKLRTRSVMEERQLANARQRHKDTRFTQLQVVWGKTFAGNAFLASPPMLWFKDFDVGRPLALGFTLTNVSNTFNHFRLLPLDDQVIELFDIAYEKPGRMSAGMSCSLKMTFTGTEERDLETILSVAAPTGVFQLPVRCTCKKSVPRISQHEIRFPDIVAGERVTVKLTLANDGALPLVYRVRRLTSNEIEPEQSVPSMDDTAELENDGKFRKEPENDDIVDADDLVKVQDDTNISETPQDDNEKQLIESTDDTENPQPSIPVESRPSSRSSAMSTELSDIRLKLLEVSTVAKAGDDVDDPLTHHEQELVTRVRELTLFHPEGADEPIRFTRRGIVAPYSSNAIQFTFAPAAAMTLDNQPFVLEFPAASSSDLRQLAPIPVLVSGIASQVPVFVANSRLDFRCCAYNKLYRHELIVCNRGKVALKIHVQVPKVLVSYVEFHPSFGFVQAAVSSQEGKFVVQVKFRPEQRMWTRVERAGLGSRELGMLAVPVQVVVPDQVIPVYFVLTARLTPSTLLLHIKTGRTNKELHFGTCCVGHSVSHELTITNTARVPQRVGVTSLPKDVTVADVSEGVGFVLLPGETRTLRAVYVPSFPGDLQAAGVMETKPRLIVWSSTFNQEYSLPCSGSAVASDLVFSHSVVRLGATALGQIQICSVNLINQSDRHTSLVELRPPPEAGPFLRITPLVARLGPRETIRLEIDFEPNETIFQLVKSCYFEGKILGDTGPVRKETNRDLPVIYARSVHADLSTGPLNSQEDEVVEASTVPPTLEAMTGPRSCHHIWTVLCFHRYEATQDGNSSSKPDSLTPLQALEVRTTAMDPFLIPSTTILNFGQVAIGQTLVRDITLETTPYVTESVLLRAQPLHILGAFRLIGALREVPVSANNRRRAIRVEFKPRTPLMYQDELHLSALGVNIRVQLLGEGINPSLSFTPADGNVDFQDVLARTRNARELVLNNGSAFPLSFSIVAFDENNDMKEADTTGDKITTSTGLPVFIFSPTSAVIPENGSINVQVIFQPDHQRPGHYSQRYRIEVPNESEQHIINVSGRCWENQLYVFVPTEAPLPAHSSDSEPRRQPFLMPGTVEDLFDLPPSISLPSSLGMNDLPITGLRRTATSFVLSFYDDMVVPNREALTTNNTDSSSSGPIMKTLFIGSTLPCSGVYGGLDEVPIATPGGSTGSFELVVDAASPYAKLFTLEPTRGAIAAGQQLAIQVTYYPSASAASDSVTPSSSARTSGAVVSSSVKLPQRRPELEVVQWVQVRVQCVLKGGSLWRMLPTPGAQVPVVGSAGSRANAGAVNVPEGADTRTVTVILRARLET